MNTRTASVSALVVCALSDLAAVPLLLGSDDGLVVVGAVVAVIGLLTLAAAYGVSRNASWSRPLAFTTRGIDVLGAVPALAAGAGAAETSAASVTIALSALVIVLLVRTHEHAVHTA